MPNANASQSYLPRNRSHIPECLRISARVFVGVCGVLLYLLVAPYTATRAHAEEFRFPGLEALMTDEEFARAGLNELTPAQRAELNRWLSQRARFKLEEITETKKQAEKQLPEKTNESSAGVLQSASEESEESAPKTTPESGKTKKPRKRLIAKRMSRAERTAVKPIRTRIVGKFTGWTGTTLFQLENGEYWKQRQAGRYYHKAESPEVELFKNRFGFWEIRILETGKTVKVSRYEP